MQQVELNLLVGANSGWRTISPHWMYLHNLKAKSHLKSHPVSGNHYLCSLKDITTFPVVNSASCPPPHPNPTFFFFFFPVLTSKNSTLPFKNGLLITDHNYKAAMTLLQIPTKKQEQWDAFLTFSFGCPFPFWCFWTIISNSF